MIYLVEVVAVCRCSENAIWNNPANGANNNEMLFYTGIK